MGVSTREHKKKPVRQEIEESKSQPNPPMEQTTTASSSAGAGHSFAKVPVKPAGQQQAGAAPQEEKLYTVRINSRTFTNLTQTQAIQALKGVYRALFIKASAGEDGHKDMKDIREDQWVVGSVSDFIGSIAHLRKVSLPPLSIWDAAHINLNGALTAINAGHVEEAQDYLKKAEDAYQNAYRLFYEYREGTISGAEYTKVGLEVTVEASKFTLSLAAKAEWGEGGEKAVDVLYGAALNAATQGGELLAGTRKEFSFKQLGGEIAKEGINILIGKLVDGVFNRYFMSHLGPYLSSSITEEELVEWGKLAGVGKLERDFLFTTGQKYLVEFLKGVASAPFEMAVSAAVKRFTESEPKKAEEGTSPKPEKSIEEVIAELSEEIIKEMGKSGIKGMFKHFLSHAFEHH